jgi:hypothetical protein
LFEIYSLEAQRRQKSGRGRGAGTGGQEAGAEESAQGRGQGQGGGGRGRVPGLPGLSSSEINIAIDGKRSILDIYNLVRAECGNVVMGNAEQKFAYVLSPDAPDVTLEAVANAILNLEKTGVVEIRRLTKSVTATATKK